MVETPSRGKDAFIRRRVYIVDDDQAVRESLLWLMESVGLEAEAYESALTFLSQAGPALSDVPGCLIADARLPGTSGLELYRQLRSLGIFLPVVIVTGHGQVDEAVAAMKAGVADYIEKPFGGLGLAELVVRLLDEIQASPGREPGQDRTARGLPMDARITRSGRH